MRVGTVLCLITTVQMVTIVSSFPESKNLDRYSKDDLIMCQNNMDLCVDFLCKRYKVSDCYSIDARRKIREGIEKVYYESVGPDNRRKSSVYDQEAENRCNDDEDCEFNLKCWNGECTRKTDGNCDSDENCRYPYLCHEKECTLLPFPGSSQLKCWSSSECPLNSVCRKTACFPIVNGQACARNKDCPSGYRCNVHKRCTAVQDENDSHRLRCEQTFDCPYDQRCSDGRCHPVKSDRHCRTDHDCNYGLYNKCSNNLCTIAARLNNRFLNRMDNRERLSNIFGDSRPIDKILPTFLVIHG